MEKIWRSVEEVHEHSLNAVDKPISDIVLKESIEKYYANTSNKGWIGNAIEQDFFGVPNNNRKEADIPYLDLEIKVTPIRKLKSGKWSAKERLVLNIFDFNDEYKRTFESASFFEKADLIELLYYEFQEGVPSPDLFIKATSLFNISELPMEDLQIIRQDWKIIVDKIKEGKAEELSDSLTKYLGATTKGAKTEANMTTQPFSPVKAHRRSFTLKGSFMTQLARKIMTAKVEESEKVIKDIQLLEEKTFEEIIIEQFEPFINKTKKELANQFDVDIPKKNDKASSYMLANKMLNLDSEIEKTDEFKKSGISVKIVTVEKGKQTTTEGFKLTIPDGQMIIDAEELVETNWEDSVLKDYLESTQFLLVVYEKDNDIVTFKGVKFWRMPLSVLENEVRVMWERTKEIFREGVELRYKATKKSQEVHNNLPKISDKMVLHVRPSANHSRYYESNDSMKLPTKSKWINRPSELKDTKYTDYYMTKQAWWLNPRYMYEQIGEIFEV